MASNRTDTEAVVNLVINGKQAMTSLKELTDTQRRLNTELRNMRPADPGYRERLQELQMINRAMQEQQAEIRGINNESTKLKTNWKDIAGGIVGGLGVSFGLSSIMDGITKMKDAYAEAEKNRAVLTNAFQGDAKKAGESLKMLMDFASKTPFGLQEATDGYLKLVNRGITPTREEMVKLGDVAASQGKSMDQYIEAIMDAQTGENERLKELGIRATKNGDTVAFSFKGVTKEVKNTEDAIYKALIGFGEMDGVAGTMDVVSKTIVGLQSNISDTWDQIFTKLGQGSEGFINGFYKTYSSILEFINDDLLSTETNAQKLTKGFQEQAATVNNLERNIEPLLSRYDELKAKGELNKDEQTELKSILEKVNNTIPSAITNWNKLGEAMDMNTGKAREFIAIQKVLLKSQNKEALAEAKKELDLYIKVRDSYHKDLMAGETKTVSGGGYTFVNKNTDKQIVEFQAQIKKYNDLIEERRLLIKGLSGDYMDEIAKGKPVSAVAATSSARTEGVIAKEIAALKDLRKEVDINSKAYSDYTAEIKKLQEELDSAGGKKSPTEKAADKLKKESEKLQDAIEKMQTDFDIKDSTGLEKKLAEISKKYDPLIAKARELKDAVKESLLLNLQEKENNKAEEEINKGSSAEIKKSNETAFNAGTNWLNDEFGRKKNANDSQLATDLSDTDTEAAKIALKEAAQLREREITEEHLIAMKLLYETYGKDSTLLDTQLTAIRIANAEREAAGKIAATQAKQQIDQAYLDSSAEATTFLKGLVNQQSFAYKGLIIADKALAMAKIIVNNQAEISGYYAKYALVPGGAIIASGLAAASRVRAGISMGIVAATGIGELIKSSSGNNTQSGDAHANGVRNVKSGKALVGEAGPELIEANGKYWLAKEPMLADLPQGANVYNADETIRMMNNRSLGERIYPQTNYSIDSDSARAAEMQYRSPYSAPQFSNSSSSNDSQNQLGNPNDEFNRLSGIVSRFIETQSKINERPVTLDYSILEKFKNEIDDVRLSQSG